MDRLRVLNRNQIKYIVIAAMLIDHIAYAYVPMKTPLGVGMRFVGRLTGPTMAYFIAEGFMHTKSRPRYALRLGLFALISWIPYALFETGSWPVLKFSVIYTLFLGFIALWVWNNDRLDPLVRLVAVFEILVLSTWGDWAYMDIIIPMIALIHRDDEKRKWTALTILCAVWTVTAFAAGIHQGIFQSGIMLVPLMLRYLYNGESGSRHPFHKWFFYIFYPAHLLILVLIKYNTIRICGTGFVLPWK